MSKYLRNEGEKEVVQISDRMFKSIWSEIEKYPTFEDFLVAVEAMRPDKEYAYSYKNHSINDYVAKHVKGFCSNLTDEFTFEKYAKQETEDDSKKRYYTGWFYPISFWSFVNSKKPIKQIPLEEYIEMKKRVYEKLKFLTNKNNYSVS